jgi:hypothetical protein
VWDAFGASGGPAARGGAYVLGYTRDVECNAGICFVPVTLQHEIKIGRRVLLRTPFSAFGAPFIFTVRGYRVPLP